MTLVMALILVDRINVMPLDDFLVCFYNKIGSSNLAVFLSFVDNLLTQILHVLCRQWGKREDTMLLQ